jgi:membrane protease YdiL (CAAX protease family)
LTGFQPERGSNDAGTGLDRRSASDESPSAQTEPEPGSAKPAAEVPRSRPGTSVFTIEGRRAPALFVVGWIGTLMGAAILVAGLLASGAAAIALVLVGLLLLVVGLVSGAGSQAIERHARGVAGYAGPSPILVFIAVIPVTILLEIVASIPLAALGVDTRSPLAELVGLLLTGVAYVGLIRLLVVGTGSLSWGEMGIRPPRAQQLTELAIGALMGFPLLVITGLLAAVLATFLPTPSSTLPVTASALGMAVNLVSATLVAPVAEETFFRGFATTAWLRTVGANGAILRGALFFALAHVLTVGGDTFAVGAERALFAFLARIPVALALGWVFVRSRSLYASIGLHALSNGLPVLVLLLAGRS